MLFGYYYSLLYIVGDLDYKVSIILIKLELRIELTSINLQFIVINLYTIQITFLKRV